MELYLIRHGQSTNNARAAQNDRLCDPPLTDLGRVQAEKLAQHLARGMGLEATGGHHEGDYGITRLYCSPMWRALQTALPVGQALGLAPEVWIEIHEHGGVYLDHGKTGGVVGHPGKTRQEILAEFPDYVLPEAITDRGWWTNGYEELSACYARAVKVADELHKWATSDERIALISHGTFMDALLKALFDQLPGRHFSYSHNNTGITRVDFRSDGRLVIRYVNRVSHLPPDLIS
ncbi:MAG TPA: histidine phosphatase family protein [Anaerolineae bacterium]|nr:histidine phosphatase family protein [Anaerolineae bacterium]